MTKIVPLASRWPTVGGWLYVAASGVPFRDAIVRSILLLAKYFSYDMANHCFVSLFFVSLHILLAGLLMPAEGDRELNINTFMGLGDGPRGCGKVIENNKK